MAETRRAVVLGVAMAALAAGCAGAEQNVQVGAPAAPATAPTTQPEPAGSVVALDGAVSAMVTDERTGTLAVALRDPNRVALLPLHERLDGAAAGQVREVELPGPAADLTMAAPGGPLLVALPAPGSVLRIDLAARGPATRIDLGGPALGVTSVGGRTVVAMGDRLAVLSGDGAVERQVTGLAEATDVVAVGGKVGLLERARSAVSLVDAEAGEAGAALRAGDGATNLTTDRFGRLVVTATRRGELLLFGGDPLVLRQRYPVPGAPYGVAFDGRRDLAWVTLTAQDAVVAFDVAGGEPVERYRFGTVHRPESVAVDQQNGRVLVGSASGAGLQVIDPERVVTR